MTSFLQIFLVGHRGAGKTTLLNGLKSLNEDSNRKFFDLDHEIEKRTEKEIDQVFHKDGESKFREFESQILADVVSENSCCTVAVGAGYQGGFPEGSLVVWIRRESDMSGRIFFDRPRLDPEESPLEEFNKRREKRDLYFKSIADFEWILVPGDGEVSKSSDSFFRGDLSRSSGWLTVLPEWLDKPAKLKEILRIIPCEGIELRDDLLTPNQVHEVRQIAGDKKTLVSFRAEGASTTESMNDADWALELGPPASAPKILSLHERINVESYEESVEEMIERIESHREDSETVLKFAPLIDSWKDLAIANRWAEENPAKNVFLPRSEDGRWRWFRLRAKSISPLCFLRIDEGSSIDQPYLSEWIGHNYESRFFAAILGSPVEHSRTPTEQAEFFASFDWPVLRIEVRQEEWKEALPVLLELGLRAAAVTSPLKKMALKSCDKASESALRFSAANTLFVTDEGLIVGENTDYSGMKHLFAEAGLVSEDRVCVWGGGGTLELLKECLPGAGFYSARSGDLRDGDSVEDPEVLVWASGARGDDNFPRHWRPKKVVDLSYAENSSARSIALRTGAEYISGEKMFLRQAAEQREFWTQEMRGPDNGE